MITMKVFIYLLALFFSITIIACYEENTNGSLIVNFKNKQRNLTIPPFKNSVGLFETINHDSLKIKELTPIRIEKIRNNQALFENISPGNYSVILLHTNYFFNVHIVSNHQTKVDFFKCYKIL